MTIKQFFSVLTMVALAAFAAAGETTDLSGREFWSTRVTVDGVEKALVSNTRIKIQFREGGRLSATAGCNSIQSDGEYSVNEENFLVMGGLTTTEMGCDQPRHQQDEFVADFLLSQPKVTLDDDESKLVLSTVSVTIEFVDRKTADPDRPLVGTHWVVKAFFNQLTTQSYNIEKAGWITFSDDGEVSFFDGCKQGKRTYSIDDEQNVINFGSAEGAEGTCDGMSGNVVTYASNFNKIFDTNSVKYDIVGPRLTLSNDNNEGVSFTASVASSGADTIDLDGREFWSTRVTVNGVERPLIKGTRIKLSFQNGGISVNAGCNSIGSGKYSVNEDGLLVLGALFMSAKGCDAARHDQDSFVSTFLELQPKVTLDDDDNKLVLSSVSITIEFVDREIADPDRPLVGTHWVVNGFFNAVDLSASSSSVDKAGWIILSDDGEASFFDGCKKGKRTYSIASDEENVINFGDTKMAEGTCDGKPDNVVSYAANFNKIFDTGSVTYEIAGPRLKLSNGNNEGVSFTVGVASTEAKTIDLDGRNFWSTRVTVGGEEKPLVSGTRIKLQFSKEGRLSANAGCNSMSSDGGYAVDEDDLLVIRGLITTEMGCDPARHQQDKFVVDFLLSQPKVTLNDDDKELVLSTDSIRIDFVDRKIADPDRPLIGTHWVVNGFFDKLTASSSSVDKAGWIKFGADRKVSFFDGCEDGERTYSLASDDKVINFGDDDEVGGTCDDMQNTAAAYASNFNKIFDTESVRYEIVGPRLSLSNENEDGVSFTASADPVGNGPADLGDTERLDYSAGTSYYSLRRGLKRSVILTILTFVITIC